MYFIELAGEQASFTASQSEGSKGTRIKAKSKKGASIADTIRGNIRKGMKPAKNLAAVQKKHKGCSTSIACVYWYQSRFNRGLEE